MEWFNQLRDLLVVNFWDREDSNILDAHVTEEEDVFEDSFSELPHAEEEMKSEDEVKEVKEEEKKETEEEKVETTISEDTVNFTKEATPQEEKQDISKVYGLFNSTSSTSKSRALINAKKTRMPASLSVKRQLLPLSVRSAIPVTVMKRSSKVPTNLSTTFPLRARPRRRHLLSLSCLNNVLGPSESPSAVIQSSPIKVFPFSEVHQTRHQENQFRDKKEDEGDGDEEEEEGVSEVDKVVSFAGSELHRTTRYQEKVAMEEVKEARKQVPLFGLLNQNISRRVRGVKRSAKVDLRRRKKMRIVG